MCLHHISAVNTLMCWRHTPGRGKPSHSCNEDRLQTLPTTQIFIINCWWLFVLFVYMFGFIIINVIFVFHTHIIIISYYSFVCVIIPYRLPPSSCDAATCLGGVTPPHLLAKLERKRSPQNKYLLFNYDDYLFYLHIYLVLL